MTAWPTDIESMAGLLVEPAKGILAADESTGTIEKRFRTVGLESTLETNRAYRHLLFTTPGIEAHISGVILFDETIRETADDGTPFAEFLTRRGIAPGIKVDGGAKPLAGAPDEKVTEGLDGLRERLRRVSRSWCPLHQVAGPRSASDRGFRATMRSASTRRPWRASPPSRKKPASCPSWSPRC